MLEFLNVTSPARSHASSARKKGMPRIDHTLKGDPLPPPPARLSSLPALQPIARGFLEKSPSVDYRFMFAEKEIVEMPALERQSCAANGTAGDVGTSGGAGSSSPDAEGEADSHRQRSALEAKICPR